MDFITISIMECLFILVLYILHKYQIKSRKSRNKIKISHDFSGIDLHQLQKNYKILNKILDNVKAGNEINDKKTD